MATPMARDARRVNTTAVGVEEDGSPDGEAVVAAAAGRTQKVRIGSARDVAFVGAKHVNAGDGHGMATNDNGIVGRGFFTAEVEPHAGSCTATGGDSRAPCAAWRMRACEIRRKRCTTIWPDV